MEASMMPFHLQKDWLTGIFSFLNGMMKVEKILKPREKIKVSSIGMYFNFSPKRVLFRWVILILEDHTLTREAFHVFKVANNLDKEKLIHDAIQA